MVPSLQTSLLNHVIHYQLTIGYQDNQELKHARRSRRILATDASQESRLRRSNLSEEGNSEARRRGYLLIYVHIYIYILDTPGGLRPPSVSLRACGPRHASKSCYPFLLARRRRRRHRRRRHLRGRRRRRCRVISVICRRRRRSGFDKNPTILQTRSRKNDEQCIHRKGESLFGRGAAVWGLGHVQRCLGLCIVIVVGGVLGVVGVVVVDVKLRQK